MNENEKEIVCAKHKTTKPAIQPPFPGPIGEKIAQHVCQEAWNEWLELQIKIINEERLDLSEKSAQERLYGEMKRFLNLEGLLP